MKLLFRIRTCRRLGLNPGWIFLLLIFINLSSCRSDMPDKDESIITEKMLRRSDVVLSWGGFDEKAAEAYGVTVWGWGPSAMYARNYRDVADNIQKGRDLGMRLVMGMVCETIRPSPRAAGFSEFEEDPELMNSMCRDIAGEPMTPSWWDIDYGNGHRTWWNCANNPAFREWFKDKAVRAIESGADGLFIDGILSNRQIVEMGGCFCDHCIRSFRNYLSGNYGPDELTAFGIEDAGTFDYRDMVRKTAADFDTYMEALRNQEIPMLDIYREFQMEEDTEFIQGVIDAARSAGEGDVPAAGNACMFWPDWLICGDFLDFFVIELDFWSEPGHMPVMQYKIASALDRPMATWPIGPSVGMIKEKGLNGMLKQWIALTYAHGANFMIPTRLWASTHESGNMSVINAPFDEYVPLYDFVRDNAVLFNGYEDYARVAVLYDNMSRRQGSWAISRICWDLLNANIPFDLVLAPDPYIPEYATARPDDLEDYDWLVVPQYSPDVLEASGMDLFSVMEEKGHAIRYKGIADLQMSLDAYISAAPKDSLWIIPRSNPGNKEVPLVIHVVNNRYDRENDILQPRSDARVRINQQMISDLKVSGVKAYMPGRDAVDLELQYSAEGDLLLELPEADLWWILALETKKIQ